MRVLVIGARGLVARAIAAAAGKAEVICRGRPDTDLTDRESLTLAIRETRPEIVINAAAWTSIDNAELERAEALACNATGPRWLAAATGEKQVPFIQLSSHFVFDGSLGRPLTETDPTNPLNWYGETRLWGELAVAGLNPRHLIVRSSWFHGGAGDTFVARLLEQACERRRLDMVADQINSPTHIGEFAEAVMAMAWAMVDAPESDPRWGTYHLTGCTGGSRAEVAQAIMKASQILGGPVCAIDPVPMESRPRLAVRPLDSRLDCTKAEKVFGIRLSDWRDTIAESVAEVLRTRMKLRP